MVGGSDMYRQQILEHYRNPRNSGELPDPTISHTGENPMCGDEIRVDMNLDTDEEIVEAIRFSGDGCAISQAAASLLTQEVEGMSVADVIELDRDDVMELLGVEVTPMRVKCAVLAEKVIQDAYRIHIGDESIEKTVTE
jgi:nitrogen fixation NifU-like protein